MIRYTLKCAQDHGFESWFRSADDFDGQVARGLVSCPICGDTGVVKSLMAPRVTTSRNKAAAPVTSPTSAPASAPSPTPATAPEAPATQTAAPATQPSPNAADMEKAIAEMRAQVEGNSDYVGMEFAAEARKMHEGETPARAIYGEAKIDDAKALLEEGVPVLPLPFTPKRKMN